MLPTPDACPMIHQTLCANNHSKKWSTRVTCMHSSQVRERSGGVSTGPHRKANRRARESKKLHFCPNELTLLPVPSAYYEADKTGLRMRRREKRGRVGRLWQRLLTKGVKPERGQQLLRPHHHLRRLRLRLRLLHHHNHHHHHHHRRPALKESGRR